MEPSECLSKRVHMGEHGERYRAGIQTCSLIYFGMTIAWAETCCRSQWSTELMASTEILRPNHGRKGTTVFYLASCFHGGNFEYQGVTIGSDENGVQLD